MRNVRLIARLDVKPPNLVKGVQLEGLRKIGDPNVFATNYYYQGADEILYEDVVASLYERNTLTDIIEKTAKDVFVPITVGGGLRSVADVRQALWCGADKVSINTAAIKNPNLISEVADKFGSQAMVLSIQAKWRGNYWEAYSDNGREHSGLDVLEWACRGEKLGAGEILLTSVDCEGRAKGFDCQLVSAVTREVSIPVIASGGMGSLRDASQVVQVSNADAIAMAHVLHYNKLTIGDVRSHLANLRIPVRSI